MNRLSAFLLFFYCVLIQSVAAQETFLDRADVFLKKYVKDGLVDYGSIEKDKELLDELVQPIKRPLPATETDEARKTFLINAYNILAIKAIADHYPVSSPYEIPGFFDKKKYEVAGKKLTLNELEKEWLLKDFKDARLHFVLVCAAMDCPPLFNKAFRPDILEEQLNKRTQLALDNSGFIKLDKKNKHIMLSEIFRWYAEDFEREGGIRTFINQHRSAPLPGDYKLKYYTYNWALNDLAQFNATGRYRASALMKTGQVELKVFNSMYTERSYDGFTQLNTRSTYFSSYIQFLYGLNNNLNIGADIVYKSNVVNDFAGDFALESLGFKNYSRFQTIACLDHNQNISPFSPCAMGGMQTVFDTLRHHDGTVLQTHGSHGFAHLGPKIKFTPFKSIGGLSLQQTLYIPIQKFVDGQTVSFTQLFYDRPIGSNQQLFIEASLWSVLAPDFRVSPFIKGFYSYFPSKKWTLYAMATVPTEVGAGVKYFVNPYLELEFLYTYYLPFDAFLGEKRPQTFNIGVRYFR